MTTLKQGMNLKLLQKLSPQQIQLMKLIQIPAVSLEQRIKEELQENPALEEGLGEDEYESTDDEFDNQDADDQFEDEVNTDIEPDDFSIKDEEPYQQSANDVVDIADYVQDEDMPYYKTAANNTGPDDDKNEIPVSVATSFSDSLYEQLGTYNLTEKQEIIAEYILGNIDDDGYVRRPIQSISDDLAFSQNITCTETEVEEVLKIIQLLEPAGIGARDLRECLLLQLERHQREHPHSRLAIEILKKYMDEFSRKHYDKIIHHLGVEEEVFKLALQEILKLNPRPGNSTQDTRAKSDVQVTPDFIIVNNDGELELSLSAKNAPDLRISRSYAEMLDFYSKDKKNKQSKEAVQFVKQKIDSAKWFIDALTQRQNTLLVTMLAIMNRQSEYLQEGDETKLRPMILKDIADEVGLDISTVSRVANSKYVQTPFGTIALKSFFSESMQTDSGEEVSSREIKRILSDTVVAENKRNPVTDEELADILKEKGYAIARRTVAKYREQLNIPVARMRKEL